MAFSNVFIKTDYPELVDNMFVNNNDIDFKQWGVFVKNHPAGTFFQSPEFFHAGQNTQNYTMVVVGHIDDKTKDLLGVVLGCIQRDFSGILGFLSARCIIWGGPLVKDDSVDVLRSLMIEFDRRIGRRVIYTQIRNFSLPVKVVVQTLYDLGYFWEDHLNIVFKLPDNEQEYWKQIARSRKDGINKAKKKEFTFETGYSQGIIEEFYSLYSGLYKRLGLPIPHISFFKALNEHAPNNIRYFVMKKNEAPIIILVAIEEDIKISAFCIGILQDAELIRDRPVDLFYYLVMLWAISNGKKYFDWMGAGKPDQEYGVRKFKLEFGGMPENFGRYIKVHKHILMSLGKMGLTVYKYMKNQMNI